MKVKLSVEVTVNDLNGFSESDVAMVFHGMGDFEKTVKSFVEGKLDNDLTVNDVTVTELGVESDDE
jgi:hypothetical protein